VRPSLLGRLAGLAGGGVALAGAALATLGGGGIGTLITASALITALLVTWRLRRKGAVMGAPHGAHRRPRLPVRPLGGRVRVAVVEPDDIIE
jgi:hypothetical protein